MSKDYIKKEMKTVNQKNKEHGEIHLVLMKFRNKILL